MEERKQDEKVDAAGRDGRPWTDPVFERVEERQATSGTGSGPADAPSSRR